MKTILSMLIIFTLSYQANSQISSTWKGGTPGHEKSWHTASNWSNNHVPDEFTDVVIPLDNSCKENYPVILRGKNEIRSIWIHRGAKINVTSTGELKIYSNEYSLFDRGQIVYDFHFSSELSANIYLTRAQ